MEQNFSQEFVGYIIGTGSPAFVIASIIFILCGSFINIAFDVHNRNEKSKNTPQKFSWSFFWLDNKLRIILCIIMALCVARFFSDIFPQQKLSLFKAFCLGLIFDWMLVFLRHLQRLIKQKFNIKEFGRAESPDITEQ